MREVKGREGTRKKGKGPAGGGGKLRVMTNGRVKAKGRRIRVKCKE